MLNILLVSEKLTVRMDDFVFQDIDFFSSVESNESNDKSDAISSFENTTSKIKKGPKSHRLNPKAF